MPENSVSLRPYLKWAGGKRQLLPAIRAHLPHDFAQRLYYEPFVGAGAVLFSLAPRQAFVNDFNEALILTYRAIQTEVEAVIALLEEHAARHCSEYYYTVRAMDRLPDFSALPAPVKAARLIYLNKTCFNGLYRVNSQGFFNVPLGSYQNPTICETSTLRAVSIFLSQQRIILRSGDFTSAVESADDRAFVYFDPPYHSPNNTNFTSYQASGFTEADQLRLRDVFAALTARGARCLLSNSDTAFIREIYAGYPMDRVPARRFINANAQGRGAVDEVLIWNW